MKRTFGFILLISFASILTWWTGPWELAAAFSRIRPGFFGFALLALVFADLLRFYKIRASLRGVLTFRESAALLFYSRVSGFISPGRSAEALPLLQAHERKKEIATFLMVDRVFEAAVLFLLGCFGLMTWKSSPLLYAVGGGLFGLAGLLVVLLYRRKGHLRQFLHGLSQNSAAFRTFLLTAFALTVTAVFVEFFALQLMLKSFNPVALPAISFLAAACMIAGLAGLALAIPAGLGISDMALVTLLFGARVSHAVAGAAVLTHRAAGLVKSAFYYGALVLLRRPS